MPNLLADVLALAAESGKPVEFDASVEYSVESERIVIRRRSTLDVVIDGQQYGPMTRVARPERVEM